MRTNRGNVLLPWQRQSYNPKNKEAVCLRAKQSCVRLEVTAIARYDMVISYESSYAIGSDNGAMTETDHNTDNQDQSTPTYDVLVVGGGIHGVSMACEAASRGLNTILVHRGKIAGSSSCAPTDTVGAGLNLLENLQLPNVISNHDELCRLSQKLPHLVTPQDAYVVQAPAIRSPRKLKFGLTIYNRMQGVKPISRGNESFYQSFNKEALADRTIREYSLNYLRVMIALLQQLDKYQSTKLFHHQLVNAERQEDYWSVNLTPQSDGEHTSPRTQMTHCHAKVIINCTGCKTNEVIKEALGITSRSSAGRLDSGHIYIDLAQEWNATAVFQRENKSLVYAHNIDNHHICIGPILADDHSDGAKNKAIDETISLWNKNTQLPITRNNIVHSRWTSHPLVDDPSKHKLASTDATFLDLNNPGKAAPLLSLFGNNLVQFRKVAEQGLDILEAFTKAKRSPLFAEEALPGGDFENKDILDVQQQLCEHYDFLPNEVITRLLMTYGTNALDILNSCKSEDALGQHFGHGLYAREVDYLKANEWADSAEDILWRRTYLGLQFTNEEVNTLTEYLTQSRNALE